MVLTVTLIMVYHANVFISGVGVLYGVGEIQRVNDNFTLLVLIRPVAVALKIICEIITFSLDK